MPEPFGRYELATLLGRGGMAEVYKARQVSQTGVGKQVVIKRILPGFSDQPEFRAMFLDEGRLTTQLSHGNLVQVFEAGEESGQLFLAMELVDGVGLDKVLERARAREVRLPPVVAVLIAIEALKGLHHAHTRQGEDGRLLRIVHRDISPDNLLLSYEGQVKVTDFGIAKAALEGRPETQSGIFKGKLMYGAPEQIRGEKIDARADLFSMGVVLHEMLSGNNPIGQKAVELAMSGSPLPRVGTFFVGEELPEIIARATASRPDERYPSALAFQQALTSWMLPRAGIHAATGIAHLMIWLFPAEAGARGLATQLDGDTMRWLESNPAAPKEPEPATPFEQTVPSGLRPKLEPREAQVVTAPEEAAPARPARPRAKTVAIGAGIAAVLLAGGFVALRASERAEEEQTLANARAAFQRRDLSRATSMLGPLIHRERPLPEAQALAAEVDAEVHPTAAIAEADRLANEAATRHDPPDWATVDHLLDVASGTSHFKPQLEQLRRRIEAVYSLPEANIAAAAKAAEEDDLEKLKSLLPCPGDACSDDWYLQQVQLELDAQHALDQTERLIAQSKVFEARVALAAAQRTLYQEPRRSRLHQQLGVSVSEGRLEGEVRAAVDAGDFATARKAIDDCHADGKICENADRVRETLDREELFDRDCRHAEEQLEAGHPWVAMRYLRGLRDRTEWQLGRGMKLLTLASQGPAAGPPDEKCQQVREAAKKTPAANLSGLIKCAAKYPESWDLKRELGVAYGAAGENRRATQCMQKYFELAPTNDPHRAEVEDTLKSLGPADRGDFKTQHGTKQQERQRKAGGP